MKWVLLIFWGASQYGAMEKIEYSTFEGCIQAQEQLIEEVDAGIIPNVKTLCLSTGD